MIARSLVCYLLSFGFIALIVFLNFPQTDISIANYFWNSGWHDKTGWYGLVYYGVYWLSPIIVVALLSLLVYLYLTSSKKFKKCTIFFLNLYPSGPWLSRQWHIQRPLGKSPALTNN